MPKPSKPTSSVERERREFGDARFPATHNKPASINVSVKSQVMMLRLLVVVFVFFIALAPARAQSLQSRADQIRAAMDARDFDRAEQLVRAFRATDGAAFTRNNYDYLLARLT